MTGTLAALAVLLFVFTGDAARIATACGAASSLLLGAIDRAEPSLGRQPARVLADVALFTPLVPLLLSHFQP